MVIVEEIKNIFPECNEIPEFVNTNIPHKQTRYLLNGQIIEWGGPFKDVYSPVCIKNGDSACQVYLGSFPDLSVSAAMSALNSSINAYCCGKGYWPTLSVENRIKHVQKFCFEMKKQKQNIVNMLMWEIGKSYQDSEKEFDRTIKYIIDTIDALKELDRTSSRFIIEQGIIGQIRRAPLGVVLCMGPYNYPLNETFTTLIPALIMGNTVLFKPPSQGVLLFDFLLEAFRDSFPEGVVNIIYGQGRVITPPLMASGKVDVLAFIGGTKAADNLKKQHPKPHRMKSVLGLEAKNTAIILPDADLDLTVEECKLGTLSFNGQRCTAIKMIYVHTSIVDEFLSRFSNSISNLKYGMPWEKDVFLTPLPELNKTNYLSELLKDATDKGAKIINESGGNVNNTFFYPAVVYPVNDQMKLYYEEQFGPIIPVMSFNDISEPIEYIIESNYGQQVSIFGNNPDEIADLIDPLVNQVSRVNINSQCQRGPDIFPFTGRKDSAEGTLSVSDALKVFSIRTLVATKEIDTNKEIISKIVKDHKSNFLSTDFIL